MKEIKLSSKKFQKFLKELGFGSVHGSFKCEYDDLYFYKNYLTKSKDRNALFLEGSIKVHNEYWNHKRGLCPIDIYFPDPTDQISTMSLCNSDISDGDYEKRETTLLVRMEAAKEIMTEMKKDIEAIRNFYKNNV